MIYEIRAGTSLLIRYRRAARCGGSEKSCREQMLELEKVYAELAEKTPDTLQLIRDRHKKPKPQALDSTIAMTTDMKLPVPENYALLTAPKTSRRTCTPDAFCILRG